MIRFLEKNKVLMIYIPLCVYWATLLLLTSLPSNNIPSLKVSDKLAHFLAYLGLGFLLSLTSRIQSKFPRLKDNHYVFTYSVIMLYGLIDELHQYFIPGRYCDYLDWIADMAGAAVGVLLLDLIIGIDRKIFQNN